MFYFCSVVRGSTIQASPKLTPTPSLSSPGFFYHFQSYSVAGEMEVVGESIIEMKVN